MNATWRVLLNIFIVKDMEALLSVFYDRIMCGFVALLYIMRWICMLAVCVCLFLCVFMRWFIEKDYNTSHWQTRRLSTASTNAEQIHCMFSCKEVFSRTWNEFCERSTTTKTCFDGIFCLMLVARSSRRVNGCGFLPRIMLFICLSSIQRKSRYRHVVCGV